jgi:hypothetical protein
VRPGGRGIAAGRGGRDSAVELVGVAAPVLPLLHPLLASGCAPDVRARGDAPPRAHDDQGDAHDGEDDPYQEQDVADLVNVEPAGCNGYRESHDGADDYEHNRKPNQPATGSPGVHGHEGCPLKLR